MAGIGCRRSRGDSCHLLRAPQRSLPAVPVALLTPLRAARLPPIPPGVALAEAFRTPGIALPETFGAPGVALAQALGPPSVAIMPALGVVIRIVLDLNHAGIGIPRKQINGNRRSLYRSSCESSSSQCHNRGNS
jgi:hypothetical protein